MRLWSQWISFTTLEVMPALALFPKQLRGTRAAKGSTPPFQATTGVSSTEVGSATLLESALYQLLDVHVEHFSVNGAAEDQFVAEKDAATNEICDAEREECRGLLG